MRVSKFLSVLTLLVARSALAQATGPTTPADEVDVFIGTGGHGHTFPAATLPFGFVQVGPDTPLKGWDGAAGYHYSDSSILGFSHTHLSGTGVGDLGDVLLLPVTGELQSGDKYQPLSANRLASPFSHANESASPGYYRVLLDRYQTTAELTTTTRVSLHKYTFPKDQTAGVVIDLVRGISNRVTAGELNVVSDRRLTGFRTTDGWAQKRTVYFVIDTAQPFKTATLEADDKAVEGDGKKAAASKVRAALDFGRLESSLLVRVGLSAVSVEQAIKNLDTEMPAADFDAVRAAARQTWNEHLSRLSIESPDPEIRRTFYTAAYRTLLAPTLYNDADGTYRGPDHQVHQGNGMQFYSTLSLWDTFRAEHPLLTLTTPERVNDFVGTMLAWYQQSPDKALPMWPLATHETRCMIGYHAVPVIADAYAKGFRNYDAKMALKAMQDTALNSYAAPKDYDQRGYVVANNDHHEQAAARTLEYAFDDWCISQFASQLGDKEVAAKFANRADNFKNVFDASTGFFRGKTADGQWREPFDPKRIDARDYTEANAWQYAFFVPHDVPALATLYGGEEATIRRLDDAFDQDVDMPNGLVDVSGLIGQYSQGNEPCHHMPYLYALLGNQDKTARRVRNILRTQYDDTPDGLCGNDDCGQMSAWYVFSSIGLYPVNSANGVYVIGSPVVNKATLKLDPKFSAGGTFTVVANNNSTANPYIQAARLNGMPLERPWVTHDEIMRGGTLELDMGMMPGRLWRKRLEPTKIVIDCRVPELKTFADKVQTTADEWFPKLVKLMRTDGTAPPREVRIVIEEKPDGVAWAAGNQITMVAKWFRDHPDDVGAAVHELTHVVQNYRNAPGWFTEGFADYTRWFLFEPESARPKPNPAKATYRDSYRTSAAFLAWVASTYGEAALLKTDRDCRAGQYKDENWQTYTGRSLQQLGDDWQAHLRAGSKTAAPG